MSSSKHRKLRLFPFVTILFCLLFVEGLFAQQQIKIKSKNSSLSTVITSLRDQYDIKLSFNDDQLSKYFITIDKSFNTADEALAFLLKEFPFNIEKSDNVFIIYPKRANASNTNKKYLIEGYVLDGTGSESLPFAGIKIEGYALLTDQKGNFSYTSNTDSLFKIQVSYLGYYKLDTAIYAGNNIAIKLYQNSIKIQEIVFETQKTERETNFGGGNIKLNHTVGDDLPGSSDNSVYNLLRLQPGILAAGEQSNDLIIWGSYRGQSKISLDGFTIFGAKNFNDNIGAVNPLMAKDLNIKKGGYGVEQGDRVGGIVDITGIDGSTFKPTLKLGINNLTLNGIASAPLSKNTSIVIAGRQTYYNLYDIYSLTSKPKNRNDDQNLIDLTVQPDYVFKDINAKFSGRSDKGDDFYLSLFSGSDKLNSAFSTQQGRLKISGTNKETNTQYGGAAFYSKTWHNGSISNFTVSSSGLNSLDDQKVNLNQKEDDKYFNSIADQERNIIKENKLKFTHRLPSTKKSNLLLGLGYTGNSTSLLVDSLGYERINELNENNRLFAFAEDAYFISPDFKITPGLRVDYNLQFQKSYLQPRLAASFNFSKNFKMTVAWGKYNQFIAYNTVTDPQGDIHYQWNVSDGKKIPVYSAQHWVLGGVYEKNNFWFNTDLYYKTTTGITRFVQNQKGRVILKGEGRAIGLDLLIKKQYKGHQAWVSYSLSKTEERFNVKQFSQFRRAPQDQRHELKFASVINLSPFYFSTTYVYGSGFPSLNPLDDPNQNQLSYRRFDTALTYKFSANKYRLEAGFSILNLFNTQNIKTGNFERIPTEQLSTVNIYSQAVPFTPTIFLNFSL